MLLAFYYFLFNINCECVKSIHSLNYWYFKDYKLTNYPWKNEEIAQKLIVYFFIFFIFAVEVENIYEDIKDKDISIPKLSGSFSSVTLKKKKINCTSSWSITDQFKVTVGVIAKVSPAGCEDPTALEVLVRAGLYHGSTSLCSLQVQF